MSGIREVVTKISGRRNKDCYSLLCYAVEAAKECDAEELQMKTILTQVCCKASRERSISAVSKALSRAVDDIWEHGDRNALEQIYGRPILERPTPKELIKRLAQYTDGMVEYRVWEEGISRLYGIIASENQPGHWLAAAPFSADKSRVEEIVSFLNRTGTSMEDFRNLFLNGKFLL